MLKPESSETSNLVVYRASAGSGKTHRLTGEYLHLLFTSPFAYKKILAVTFTNKATDEMKTRIITELAKLAGGEKSDYMSELLKTVRKPEEEIREQARKTLVNILHDYSAFSISTIDRFFQQTMRSFTREIGLGGSYNVELDTKKVLREAIDSMLYDLERKGNSRLLEWLIRFSEEKIENGETWNIRRDIQGLSEEIFKESYKAFSDKVQENIADKDSLEEYRKTIVAYIRNFEKISKEIATKAINIMDRCGVKPEDFKGGSRSAFCNFLKWATGKKDAPKDSFLKLADTIDNWYSAKTDKSIREKIEQAYSEGLNECVCNIISHYADCTEYQTACEINRYFFTLGILGDVDKKIREYAAENNIMLISDTTEFLSKIVLASDPPFIYEKIGTQIDHYMIDEFQDTSSMQWVNFLPLVKDSLGTGKRNLIVGDVKQSIYRWRNSDWKLLEHQLNSDFRTEGIQHRYLDTNWRSGTNIIYFNNSVFDIASRLLQREFNETVSPDCEDERIKVLTHRIESAYTGVHQVPPQRKKVDEGHVKIEFIDCKENPDWQSCVLEKLPLQIECLQDKGYSLKDIAILVRTKKEGADVANTLLQYKRNNPSSTYKYDIISDEALFLERSKSIKLIISLLKYMRYPADKSLKAMAVYEYHKVNGQLTPEEALQEHFSYDADFPEEISKKLLSIQNMPLYEMAESIFFLFYKSMDEYDNIYIQAFLDALLEFTIKNSSDLDAFLQWWDESGSSKTLFTPEGQEAIRIMTIHKSKGLGFKVVLLPFCNWEIDHKLSTILWCRPQAEPFNQLHLVPVKYSQKLKNTIFEFEYFNEKLHAFIDNLNVLYVAFTRAEKELIVYAPRPKTEKVSNISSLLWCAIKNYENTENTDKCINLTETFDDEKGIFELGETYKPTPTKEKKTMGEIHMDRLVSIAFENRLRLKLNNTYYFAENGMREYGTLMHEIISKINSQRDIDRTVESYYLAGDITEKEQEKIRETLYSFLTTEQVADWYSGEYKVLNEVTILKPEGTISRPDRIMIKDDKVTIVDYKFGEKEDRSYIRQIKQYGGYIRKMGYEQILGYICYVTLGKIQEVECS